MRVLDRLPATIGSHALSLLAARRDWFGFDILLDSGDPAPGHVARRVRGGHSVCGTHRGDSIRPEVPTVTMRRPVRDHKGHGVARYLQRRTAAIARKVGSMTAPTAPFTDCSP